MFINPLRQKAADLQRELFLLSAAAAKASRPKLEGCLSSIGRLNTSNKTNIANEGQGKKRKKLMR